MEYKQICNVFIVRMDPGEEICAKLLEISEKENISLAKIDKMENGSIKKVELVKSRSMFDE